MAKSKNNNENKTARIPIITILGHVDHGKTSILDKIRESNIQLKEVGGITQKISVFTITTKSGKELTFIDTPGHEAFDLMRLRGGNIADIVILVVAANDGIKPQTEESIEIIKNSQAKPIVAVNKVDLPNTDIDKIKQELSGKGILLEEYGGSTPIVKVSAKEGTGVEELLETINLIVDVEGLVEREALKDNILGRAFILESVKHGSRGYVSSLVVTQGSLTKGDWLVYKHDEEINIERVKGFIDESGQTLDTLNAGEGGQLLGLSNLLDLGVEVFAISKKDMKLAKECYTETSKKKVTKESAEEKDTPSDSEEAEDGGLKLEDLFKADQDEATEELESLNVVLKSSSEGSLEAIVNSINALEVEGYKVEIVHSGVGEITMGDVKKAEVTKSIVLGFEVGVDNSAQSEAEQRGVLIRQYDIIYKLIEEVADVLATMATPEESEEEIGEAEIREIFVLSNGNKVLGGRVKSGIIKRGVKCYIVRNDEIIGEGKVTSLKHGKEDITETGKGGDFGAVIEPTPAAEVGDKIHCFKVTKQ